MARGQRGRPQARRFAAADALPRGRVVPVRSKDGIRLHAEVFGPEDGYPIVLAHGITCALRVWAYQIADLAKTTASSRSTTAATAERRPPRGAAVTA